MKNMFNENGKKEGYWEDYNLFGDVCLKGNYSNGKRVGYWEWFIYQGRTLIMKMSYVIGKKGYKYEEYARIIAAGEERDDSSCSEAL